MLRVLCIAVCACHPPPVPADAPIVPLDDNGCVFLPIGSFRTDGGFAYMVLGTIGSFGVADDQFAPDRSTLRLFEDDVELGPPHAVHNDIRNLGLGRFSHFTSTTNTDDSIRFAASDNSDPRSNGRQYAYCPD